MADSFMIGKEMHRETGCFSYFNNSIIIDNKNGLKRDYYIILENYKYSEYSEDDLNLFLSSIKKIGIIDFTEVYINKDLYLKLNYNGQNKSYLQYTGMVVRCLYEKLGSQDLFHVIGKHFINLCRYFEDIDKGLLFTLACNIFCVEYNELPLRSSYGYNSNHILMLPCGCKSLTTEQIMCELDKGDGINNNFTRNIVKNNYKLDNCSKESYLKLIKQNGIK